MSQRRFGCCSFIFYTFLLLFGLAIVILLVSGYIINSNYVTWKNIFENSHLEKDFTTLDSEKSKVLDKSITEKIDKFSKSTKQIDFVEFTNDEALLIIGQEINSSLPADFAVRKLYLDPLKNDWTIYIQFSYKNYNLPWINCELQKDDIETAQLYINSMYIGPFNVDELGFRPTRLAINNGMQNALVLVNENEFTGRKFQNIEMGTESMIVKGELNGGGIKE